MCPLCNEFPESIYHIIISCKFVNTIWSNLLPTLYKILEKNIDDQEKSLGIIQIKNKPEITLRNWITYKIREQILLFEKKAYHSSKAASVKLFQEEFNQSLFREVKHLMYRFDSEGKLSAFEEIIAYKGIICEKRGQGRYKLKKAFPI